MSSSLTPIKVDIWSDVACPWCYIGKRKFEAGATAFAGTDASVPVEIEYHSYELSPDTPEDWSGSHVEYLKQKGFPAGQIDQMLDRVTSIAAEVGLDYDYDALQSTKTLKAHEVLHLAKAHGKQIEMKERLLKAYFEQGRHIGHVDELAGLAAEVGLDPDEVLTALADGRYADDVQADIDQAKAYGITGVPFFVIEGKYGISGAQAPEAFTQALAQVAAEKSQAEHSQADQSQAEVRA